MTCFALCLQNFEVLNFSHIKILMKKNGYFDVTKLIIDQINKKDVERQDIRLNQQARILYRSDYRR